MIECKTDGLLEAEEVGHVLLTIILLWVPDGQGLSFVFLLTVCLPVEMPGLPLLESYCGLSWQTDVCFSFSPVF